VVIVADDLTGACDAAAPFAARGADCVVSLWNRPLACHPIVSISTETRDEEESEIRRRMQAVADGVGPRSIVFKKIDSTLRGNVIAEIQAAMDAFERPAAVVTPAFPDMGRRVCDGRLHIDGHAPIETTLSILDAVCNEDLDRMVSGNLSEPVLWAGSAGLASALARKLYGQPKPLAAPSLQGPLVFCIGSDHPATVAQVSALHGQPIFPILRGQTTPDEIRYALRTAGAIFVTGGDTASLVLSSIGAYGIALQHEVVTGVPWGWLLGGDLAGHPVVTKSGGFGAPDTLIRVAEFFRNEE
jgi:uncharacterized protein YgbK (DUF1537 family)